MKKATLQLETLTCPSCVKKIETLLTRTDGVDSVNILFATSKVKVIFNDNLTQLDSLEKSIGQLGFKVLSSKISN